MGNRSARGRDAVFRTVPHRLASYFSSALEMTILCTSLVPS